MICILIFVLFVFYVLSSMPMDDVSIKANLLNELGLYIELKKISTLPIYFLYLINILLYDKITPIVLC